MEALFMQAFERRNAAEAQMRQQAASYSGNLACALLAAGHLPPPWLLPHPAAFAALVRRGAAEAQMRLQVEAFSQSRACALIDACHLPPPWLLPHGTAVGTFERSVPADARMRQQVVSYSLSRACALLAAGHRPPPWLLQSPADVATEGDTSPSFFPIYLAKPKSADHVQHVLSEINHQVKQNTLEAVGSLEVPRSETLEGSSSMDSPLLEKDPSYSTKHSLSAASSKSSRVSDKSMPVLECQSFSVPVPSDSPTINERAHQAFCESKKLIKLSSNLSVKYKIKPLDGVYQSLPSKFENLMNRSLAYSIDTNLLDPSNDSKKLGVLDFDASFMMSNDQTSSSSNVYNVQEDSDVPLTLSFEKYDLEKLHGMTGSSSDYLGSIRGFGCFKIDEDITILRGTVNQEKPSHSIVKNYSRQCLGGKKALRYATNIYQSKGTNSLDLTVGKPYTRKPDQHVHMRVNRDIKNPKEVHALSTMNSRETSHPLHDRLNKKEMSCTKSERNRRGTNLEKGCRPRNTVSKMASITPLVKQNQQFPKSCAKRDVRVRALKVAAAVKRREEKKQTEREMHKAAVKLELERLKQEKEHLRKQVEHKKMEADFISRNRQREGDGKWENDRNKKGAEEAPKHQKQLDIVKDACPNDTDGKDLVENLVKPVKNQLLSDEWMESVHRLLASESNSVKAMYSNWKPAGCGLQVQENLSDNMDKAYAMSPYEDSDEKDFENSEHKRKISCRRKLIPSWAQKENLDKILLSNLALDPREVFAHECSLILSDVLVPGIPHRPSH